MAELDVARADWLKPFVEKLGHKKRRQMCPVYISGLIGPGDRKSIEPMADRLAPDRYDRLHHFIPRMGFGIGLDHFEGRSWQGLHRHALMTMIAYAFLQHQRLNKAKREKRKRHGPPKPTLPAIRRAVIASLSSHRTLQRCPHCRISFQMTSNSILPK